jgi:hypothetical protein
MLAQSPFREYTDQLAMSVKLLPLWMALAAALASAAEPSKADDPPPPEKVRRWIEQLDSDEYWTREEASKRLFQAGSSAIEPLATAARSDKLEVSTRAVGVLARLLELEDAQVELAAETALEEIAASRVTSAASRAESVLDGYRGSRQDRTLAKLRQLGAAVATQAISTGEIVLADVTIGEGWRGTTADLAALKRVPSLQRLSIYAESVNDTAVKHLAPLKQLSTLELFGTGISDDAFERLTKSLAGTKIDRRKGGLLGVQGSPTVQGGCLVSYVQAESAAEKAGLQVGDLIKRFEGQPVDDFNTLTKLIATKGGGDSVEIEFERQTQVGEKIERQTLTKKATLDRWKSRPTMTMYNDNGVPIIIGR